jgi:photosystem II stability/assembly factor-like uncharacterized protein
VLSAALCPLDGCKLSSPQTLPGVDAAGKVDAAPESLWTVARIPSPSPDNLTAVADLGGEIYIASQLGRLMKSSDDGAQFAEVYHGDFTLLALSGTAADDVWAAGSAKGGEGLLLHSSDGGLSWQEHRGSPAGELSGVWAVDREHVFAAGKRGIAATADGGRQWSLAYADPSLFFVAIWASGLDDVYAAGGTLSPASAMDAGDDADGGRVGVDALPWWGGVLVHSADGGTTWQRVVSDAGCTLWAVSGSPDGRVVYAVGDFDTRVFTTDRGATWNKQTQAGVPVSSSDPDNPHATNRGVWVSPTSRIHVLRPRRVERLDEQGHPNHEDLPSLTDDGGYADWAGALAVRGTSDDDIWVVGADGFIWHKHRPAP